MFTDARKFFASAVLSFLLLFEVIAAEPISLSLEDSVRLSLKTILLFNRKKLQSQLLDLETILLGMPFYLI